MWNKDNLESHIFIAIDGRSASGKTTLSEKLEKMLPCEVIHMDDFFLPIAKRTEDWQEIAGGNIDFERLLKEVLIPLQNGQMCEVRPFDCKKQREKDGYVLGRERIIVIEGAYSCHPKLWDYSELHVFMDVDEETQGKRIYARNGKNGLEMFRKTWIPLEERYLSKYKIKERCELHL